MRILFADDLKDTRDLFTFVLEMYGSIVTSVNDGRAAVQAAQNAAQRFDGIVLDIEMPVMNGWEALDAIRQLPGYEQVPVILFTAYHDVSTEARAKKVGASLLLKKPVLPHEFGRHVREAIQHHQLDKLMS
jgi:CheY-like chemotaxis protein